LLAVSIRRAITTTARETNCAVILDYPRKRITNSVQGKMWLPQDPSASGKGSHFKAIAGTAAADVVDGARSRHRCAIG
jgi:hypothetical protein